MKSAVRAGFSAGLRQAQPERIFSWPLRVYWEDTDAGGIVFYANYLKFFERARTEWLRSLGIGQQRLKEETGGIFVVTDTQLRYHRPARLDDELIVTATVIEKGRASLIIAQQALLKTEQSGQSHTSQSNEQFSAGPPHGKSAPFPGERGRVMPEAREAKSVGATLLCEGTIRIGWVNASTLQPMRIPVSILDSLTPPQSATT